MKTDAVYTIQEFADLLKLSYQSIYRMIRDGNIKAVQFGNMWRIPVGELEQILTRDKIEILEVSSKK